MSILNSSSQNAFAASASGSKGKTAPDAPISSTKTFMSAKHSQTSISTGSFHQKPSSSISVNFNDQVGKIPNPVPNNSLFMQTSRDLIANKNNWKQADYSHEQNGKIMKERLSNKSLPVPTFEMNFSSSRDLKQDYENFIHMHQARDEEIHVKFQTKEQRIRQTGMTLDASFNGKSAKAHESSDTSVQKTTKKIETEKTVFKRREVNFRGYDKANEKDRER